MTEERDTANKIVNLLNQRAARLDASTAEKLAAARLRAVAVMQASAETAPAELAHAGRAGHHFPRLHWHGRHAWLTWMAVLTLALIALATMRQHAYNEPVEADALLLASDLPPEAYLDKGFDAWLENSSQP